MIHFLNRYEQVFLSAPAARSSFNIFPKTDPPDTECTEDQASLCKGE